MKKSFKVLYSALAVLLLMLAVLPMAVAVSVGSPISPNIVTENFPPLVWMCDSRVVVDDNTEPGRFDDGPVFAQKLEDCPAGVTPATYCTDVCQRFDDPNTLIDESLGCIATCLAVSANLSLLDPTIPPRLICPILKGPELVERINNYAFEGEKIEWKVLVMDKNGVEKISDVFATIGDTQGAGNDIEVNCLRLNGFASSGDDLLPECNARILEEELTTFDDQTMAYYECTFTVETPESMFGEYWITVEAVDMDNLPGTMAENEYWFLNPVVALSFDGSMTFDDGVRPGTDSYSTTLAVVNDADPDTGVLMDMFISGTDFYDSSSSGAKCPISNQLELSNFRYFATNGAYSTQNDAEVDLVAGDAIQRDRDAEGYVNIDYGIGFNNPNPFYDNMEILQSNSKTGPYYLGNILAPGAEMAITFKLSLPEPCNGDFDSGSIYFWGEAI